MKARKPEDGPWAWVSKRAIRAIEEASCELGMNQTSTMLTYLALCLISSDLPGNESFKCPVGLIAKKAGLSVRTIHSVLPFLEALRIVHIFRKRSEETYMKEPSEYTLLPQSEILWQFYDKPEEHTSRNERQVVEA